MDIITTALMLAWHNGFILASGWRDPGELVLPGGMVQRDETALTTAIREMREQTGVVPDDRVTEVFSRAADGTPSGRAVIVFETRIQAIRPRIVAEKGIRVAWVHPEHLAYGNAFSDFNSELFTALGLELLPEVGDAVISGPGLLGPPDTIRGAISSLRSSIDMIGRNP